MYVFTMFDPALFMHVNNVDKQIHSVKIHYIFTIFKYRNIVENIEIIANASVEYLLVITLN